MKLELLIRKAVPFLLIAILIACLFSKPRKEGMKGVKHWYEKDHGKNAELSVVVPTGTLIGGALIGTGYMTYQGAKYERHMKVLREQTKRDNENAKNEVKVMDHTSNDISSNAAELSNDAADASKLDVE